MYETMFVNTYLSFASVVGWESSTTNDGEILRFIVMLELLLSRTNRVPQNLANLWDNSLRYNIKSSLSNNKRFLKELLEHYSNIMKNGFVNKKNINVNSPVNRIMRFYNTTSRNRTITPVLRQGIAV
jgi:hypothetical protein